MVPEAEDRPQVWDHDRLPLELVELQKLNFDLNLTGFSREELVQLMEPVTGPGLSDPDEIPDPPDEPKTKSGDLWHLGHHRNSRGVTKPRMSGATRSVVDPNWAACFNSVPRNRSALIS